MTQNAPTRVKAESSNGVVKQDGGSLLESLLAIGKNTDTRAYIDVPLERLGVKEDGQSLKTVRVRALTPAEFRNCDARARNNATGVRNEALFATVLTIETVVLDGPSDEDPIGPSLFKGENLQKLGFSVSQDLEAVQAYFFSGEIERIGTAALRVIGYAPASDLEQTVKKALKSGTPS